MAAVLRRRERPQRLAIVAAFVALGGGWHHHRWSDLPPDHLAWSIVEGDRPRPSWVRGVLVAEPRFRPPESPRRDGSTRTVLEVSGIFDGARWQPASGRVALYVDGDRPDLAMGEPVEVVGALGPVSGPLNPGEFDSRAALRGDGVRLRMSADGSGVWVDPDGVGSTWRRWLGQAREWSLARLEAGLGPETAPLASALVLGRREAVGPDVNDAFARTGTTHLLAISGLHLQVLALTLLMSLPAGGAGAEMVVGVVGLGDDRLRRAGRAVPSLVRSAAMTLVVCLSVLRFRATRSANVLAAAALVTLLWNPTDLFDTGCQLSFLAIGAIFWLVPRAIRFLQGNVPRASFELGWVAFTLRLSDNPLDALERKLAPAWKKALFRLRDQVALMLVVSAVVGLVTAPLMALRFHLIAPIGILLNVPLIPMTSMALVLAAGTLPLSAFWPPLGGPSAWAASWLLEWSESIVRWGAALPFGHAFTVGPAVWWVLGFYALGALSVFVSVARPPVPVALGGRGRGGGVAGGRGGHGPARSPRGWPRNRGAGGGPRPVGDRSRRLRAHDALRLRPDGRPDGRPSRDRPGPLVAGGVADRRDHPISCRFRPLQRPARPARTVPGGGRAGRVGVRRPDQSGRRRPADAHPVAGRSGTIGRGR